MKTFLYKNWLPIIILIFLFLFYRQYNQDMYLVKNTLADIRGKFGYTKQELIDAGAKPVGTLKSCLENVDVWQDQDWLKVCKDKGINDKCGLTREEAEYLDNKRGRERQDCFNSTN